MSEAETNKQKKRKIKQEWQIWVGMDSMGGGVSYFNLLSEHVKLDQDKYLEKPNKAPMDCEAT